jgi:guanylate kinase
MPSVQNKIIIITAPSGAGKTSITKHLLKTFPEKLAFSISAATRKKRDYEKDGADYYFISVGDFKNKIQQNEFVEWEMVYDGKYYGTLRSELERIWHLNKIPLLDVDVQGALHVQSQFPKTSLSLFIQPPSIDELKRRLESRGTESDDSLQARINKASYELSFSHEFDQVIINSDLENACKEAEEIVKHFISNDVF